jgi:hypothetical protein
MTNAIRIDHFTKKILISKSFAKAAGNPNSIEFSDLNTIRAAHPTYTVERRTIKKYPPRENYDGLTYEFMRDYIYLVTPPEDELAAIAEFDNLLLISRCHTKSTRYITIRRWFLTKYPELTKFSECYRDAMDKIMKKHEAENAA